MNILIEHIHILNENHYSKSKLELIDKIGDNFKLVLMKTELINNTSKGYPKTIQPVQTLSYDDLSYVIHARRDYEVS